MNWWHVVFALGLLLAHTCANDFQYYAYETFINPYAVDNKFMVDCGNPTVRKMHIVFRGDAMRVFGPNNPGCEAEETEPGHFEFSDAMNDDACSPNEDADLSIFTLELVVQKTTVRRFDDPIHLVSCNYELGATQESDSKGADDSALQRLPEMYHVGNISESTFTLKLHDVHNEEVDEVKIGAYVQLVATMDPGSTSELSFRVWNCRAFTNSTGIYVEHYILIEGCGDGNVIKINRGFRTAETTNSNGDTIRKARSVYFRAFSLLGSESVKFECDFIVRTDSSSDGKSCRRSPSVRRRRRAIWGDSLPFTESEDVILLSPVDPNDKDDVITYYVESENVVPQYDPSLNPRPLTAERRNRVHDNGDRLERVLNLMHDNVNREDEQDPEDEHENSEHENHEHENREQDNENHEYENQDSEHKNENREHKNKNSVHENENREHENGEQNNENRVHDSPVAQRRVHENHIQGSSAHVEFVRGRLSEVKSPNPVIVSALPTVSLLSQPLVIGLLVGLVLMVVLVVVLVAVGVGRYSLPRAARGYTKALVVEPPMDTSVIGQQWPNFSRRHLSLFSK